MDETRRSVRAINLGQFNRFVNDDLDRREFGDQFVHGDAQDVPIDRGQICNGVFGCAHAQQRVDVSAVDRYAADKL